MRRFLLILLSVILVGSHSVTDTIQPLHGDVKSFSATQAFQISNNLCKQLAVQVEAEKFSENSCADVPPANVDDNVHCVADCGLSIVLLISNDLPVVSDLAAPMVRSIAPVVNSGPFRPPIG